MVHWMACLHGSRVGHRARASDKPVPPQTTCMLQLLTNSIHHYNCHPVVRGRNNVENPVFVFCRFVVFLGVGGASALRHREYAFLGILLSLMSELDGRPVTFVASFTATSRFLSVEQCGFWEKNRLTV